MTAPPKCSTVVMSNGTPCFEPPIQLFPVRDSFRLGIVGNNIFSSSVHGALDVHEITRRGDARLPLAAGVRATQGGILCDFSRLGDKSKENETGR